MIGKILVADGKSVRNEYGEGVLYSLTDEEEAFLCWSKGDFSQHEREWSENYRKVKSNLERPQGPPIAEVGKGGDIAVLYSQVKAWAALEDKQEERFWSMLSWVQMRGTLSMSAIARWRSCGRPHLKDYCPYAYYAWIIYLLADAAVKKGQCDPGDAMDICYLFYLPFCQVFVSSDKFHRRWAGILMNDNQEFVWGEDLKRSLKEIVSHYDALPESEMERGLEAIAPHPPDIPGSVVTELYSKYLPRSGKNSKGAIDADQNRLLANWLRAASAEEKSNAVITDTSARFAVKRLAAPRRGKWWIFPKDQIVSLKNEGLDE